MCPSGSLGSSTPSFGFSISQVTDILKCSSHLKGAQVWDFPSLRFSWFLPVFCYFVTDPQDASKKLIFITILSAYYFLKVHLHHFSKIKSQKESQYSRNQGFSYYFCMMIDAWWSGSGSGSGSIPHGSGSGSVRPKNMRIWWIRIRNTDFYTIKSLWEDDYGVKIKKMLTNI